MSEAGKTLTFVAAGALAVTAAYFIDSQAAVVDVKQFVGQYLNQDIDVAAPKRLRIVKFDRQTTSLREFEVAEIDGVWSIPSKQDYPADATRQMAEAATALMDRKILRVAAETAEAHADLGVVDPRSAKLDSKATGVGTRVVMTDAEDKDLVDMIIGKPVKDAAGQRYVRRSNQNVVYVVELDPASLSTGFDDWIEDDLLKLNPFDIRKLFVNDYSADLGFVLTPEGLRSRVSWDRRGEITLTYDNAEAKWQLGQLKKFDSAKKELVDDAMGEGEEVDQDALGKLRNGLDDLLIVDVAKKPDGLSADLKAGEDFLKDEEAFEDLIKKGFSPVAINGSEPEILSSEGEIVCTLRDGVEYVLRFGQLQVQTETAEDGEEAAAAEPAAPGSPAADQAAKANESPAVPPAAQAAADKAEADKKEGENLRRYLFVMARFNKDAIEKPKLKDVPELPAQPEKPADPPATDDAPAEQPSGEAAATPDANDEKPAEDNGAPAEDEASDESDDANDDQEDEEAKDEATEEETAKLEKLVAERKAIEEENQRLEDEYDEAVKGGEKKVAELNERFGDWYYVISDDVYKQIHLGREQIIRKKDKPAEAGKEQASGADSPDASSGLPNLPAAPVAEPPADAQPAEQPAEQPAVESEAPAAGAENAESQEVPVSESQ